MFHKKKPTLLFAGLIEAAGIGWDGRDKQAKLIAKYLKAIDDDSPKLKKMLEQIQQEEQ